MHITKIDTAHQADAKSSVHLAPEAHYQFALLKFIPTKSGPQFNWSHFMTPSPLMKPAPEATPERVERCLQKALDLLDENSWTTGALARTKGGMSCHPCDKRADKFCPWGAMIAADPAMASVPTDLFRIIADATSEISGGRTGRLDTFNDKMATNVCEVRLVLVTAMRLNAERSWWAA